MSKVKFHYNYKNIPLQRKQGVKSFIEKIFLDEGIVLEGLNYIFCSDDYLHSINKAHLNHDTYTDCITFNLSVEPARIIGESYISLDRVLENSKKFNVPYYNELLRVIFHSALHLCGYNDKTKRETLIMRAKEDYYLRLFGQNI